MNIRSHTAIGGREVVTTGGLALAGGGGGAAAAGVGSSSHASAGAITLPARGCTYPNPRAGEGAVGTGLGAAGGAGFENAAEEPSAGAFRLIAAMSTLPTGV